MHLQPGISLPRQQTNNGLRHSFVVESGLDFTKLMTQHQLNFLLTATTCFRLFEWLSVGTNTFWAPFALCRFFRRSELWRCSESWRSTWQWAFHETARQQGREFMLLSPTTAAPTPVLRGLRRHDATGDVTSRIPSRLLWCSPRRLTSVHNCTSATSTVL